MLDDVTKRAELNVLGPEVPPDSVMAQDIHLGRPLEAVRRLRSDPSAGMAAEFGQSGRQIRQDGDERFDRERLRQREAVRGLPIEAATILDVGTQVPQRDIEPTGELDGGRPDGLALMDMLVRIEVGRI